MTAGEFVIGALVAVWLLAILMSNRNRSGAPPTPASSTFPKKCPGCGAWRDTGAACPCGPQVLEYQDWESQRRGPFR